MLQLKFNDDFTSIIKDIPHWKVEQDIPASIIEFIKETSNRRVFYEESTGAFYCGKCITKLKQNNYCPVCNITYKQYPSDYISLIDNKDVTITDEVAVGTNERYLLNHTCNYFVFDIMGQNVLLYCITENIFYDNPFYHKPYKSSKLSIDLSKSYFIEQNGITSLATNFYTPFQFFDTCKREMENDSYKFYQKRQSLAEYKIYDDIALIEHNAYLYTDNLANLKKTIYKYSKIWLLKSYLKEIPGFTISQLTLNPLFYSSFEYLINYNLYDLAWYNADSFTQGKTFKEIFGVDKKYLPFMAQNNISLNELKVLDLYPTTNIEVIKFFVELTWGNIDSLYELVETYKIDLQTLKDYLLKQNLTSQYLGDYLDYISMAGELHLDLKNKKVLYPKKLQEAHDELYNQIETAEDPIINEKISHLSNALAINIYEDDNYIIYPATSIADLTEESRQQKNCVRTYSERIANNKCQIYFMREKKDITKSFVTIEVCNKKIVQARVKYNKLPSEEISKILEKWEKTLVQVTIKEYF